MKRLQRLTLLGLLVAGTMMLAGATAWAQETAPMTDAHIQRIQTNCLQAQSRLSQLHASDALLRVNRGQLYDLISTRLMAPMNSRLAINHLDASKLIMVTESFDKALNQFRSAYQAYEEQLSSTMRIDCRKEPVAFYDAVTKSRQLRSNVHSAVSDMGRFIGDYGQEFDVFNGNFKDQKAVSS